MVGFFLVLVFSFPHYEVLLGVYLEGLFIGPYFGFENYVLYRQSLKVTDARLELACARERDLLQSIDVHALGGIAPRGPVPSETLLCPSPGSLPPRPALHPVRLWAGSRAPARPSTWCPA